MKILNTELEFDFLDADDMERLEKAVDETSKKLNNINTDRKTSEIIRESCEVIFDCFNTIFGENSDKRIFGEKRNFNVCIKAFKDLVKAKEEQEKAFEKEVADIEEKYSPNRATRRAKK